jgi:hypothetical protein
MVTSTPRTAPTTIVAVAVPRSSRTGNLSRQKANDAAAEHQDDGGQQQDAAQDNGDQAAGCFAWPLNLIARDRKGTVTVSTLEALTGDRAGSFAA